MRLHFLSLLATSVLFAIGARAKCTYDCTCEPTTRGQYCGYCPQVTSCQDDACFTRVYECNPEGGCCDYGPRDSCKYDEFDPYQCPI